MKSTRNRNSLGPELILFSSICLLLWGCSSARQSSRADQTARSGAAEPTIEIANASINNDVEVLGIANVHPESLVAAIETKKDVNASEIELTVGGIVYSCVTLEHLPELLACVGRRPEGVGPFHILLSGEGAEDEVGLGRHFLPPSMRYLICTDGERCFRAAEKKECERTEVQASDGAVHKYLICLDQNNNVHASETEVIPPPPWMITPEA